MDFITKVVSGIVVKIVETTVGPLYCQVGYVIHYKSNLQNLRSQVENLGYAKDRMQHTLDDEIKRKGKRVERDVENWLTKVDQITQEVVVFLEDERHAKTKCFHGFCPNPILRYRLSRKSTKLVQKVDQFHEKREFPTVAYYVPLQDVCSIQSQDYLAFESRLSIVKDIMEKLRNPDTNMIGVYGIGGVGKTTLAKEVYRQATEEKLFDDVIIVLDVKLIPDLERLQRQILEKLGMEVIDGQSIAIRASLLFDSIKDKSVLIILDDVPERIDLETMGVLSVPTCKLMVTARNRRVLCSEMRTQEDFRLDVLGEIETWSLFEKVAGDIVKENPIRTVAIEVAKKCGGLPILVVAVASALRISTLHEWKDALRRLKKFDMKELAEKALLTLEWSYSQLDDEELKPLFLLCGIIAWSNNMINLNNCFKYSMGLGLLKQVDTMEEAQAAFHSLIKKLQNYCLLLEQQDGIGIGSTYVRIHELVRNVANMIARRDQHVLVRESEELFEEWPNKAFFNQCTMIFLHLSNIPTLPEVPGQCQELKLFHLHSRDRSLQIGSNFFKEMKELKVLDLKGLLVLSLPSSLQFLTSLQTLCLDQCILGDIALVGKLRNLEILSFVGSKIEQLPEEIGQLTHLRLLDLTSCSELVLIPPNVLSSLKSLEDLRMGKNSFRQWEAEIYGNRRTTNASLSELKQLSKLTALDINIPDASVLPSGCFLHLERYHVVIGEAWKWQFFNNSFNTLKLKLATSNQLDRGLEMLVKRCEHLHLDVMEGVNNIFHLLDSEGFQQLKRLQVENNAEITHVINHNVFQKLQSLTLMNLPKLVSFSSNSRTAFATTTTDEQLKTDGECKEIILENEIGSPVQLFKNGEIVMPNLTTLIVHKCDGLRFLLSSSMAESLVQLEYLEVHNCTIMEEIVSTNEFGEEMNTNNILCKLKHLQLKRLPQLTRFCIGNYIDFPSLEILHVGDCTKLETFIFDPAMIKNEETDSKDNLFTPGPDFLFDGKVGLPSLVRLVIYDLPKLITIWHNQLPQDSFCKLKKVDVQRCHNLIKIFAASIMRRLNALDTLKIRNCKSIQVVFELGGINVERHDDPSTTQMRMSYCQNLDLIEIDSCESLKNILPVSVAKSLKQLRKLSVAICNGVEAIVAKEGQETTPNFVFPKAASVTFNDLPQMKCFYNGRHASKWSLLKELSMNACGNVDIFASEFSRFQKNLGSTQPFFLIEKDSFPNLEHLTLGGTKLEICDSPLPAEMSSKLKYLKIASPRFKSSYAFLQKLYNLETLIVHNSLLEEIFVDLGNGSGQIHAAGTQLPHLTSLMLKELSMLMHLGKENSQPVIPNLEILEVSLCGKLKNLSSPAISFQNLKTLKVIGCQGLEYLLTSSIIAQSLMQLTHLEVKDCERLVEIVGSSSENEAGNEIAFNRLEHLELSGLPSLQCFFSGTMLSHQFSICNEIEKSGTKENLDSAVQYFLFDKKVGLPRLETLIIHDLHKLMTIWHEQLAKEEDDTSITPSKLPEYCQNLVSVEIHSCRSLRNIFPASVAIGLQQLKKLSVKKCNRVEEIVAMEGLGMTTPEFVFPNATSVEFQKLPRLASFYPGLHTSVWPLLKSLTVTGCKNVEVLALEYSRFQANPELGLTGAPIKQPLFLLENLSLHLSRLEELHLHSMEGAMKNWWSPYPAELFSKLKSLWSESLVFQSGVLKNLPHLEDLMLHGFEKEVFVHEGISSGEIQAVGQLLPHLKRLWLFMPELMHLGKENYQPVIPNLEFLRVVLCGKLKNLTSPAVSFQNLKTLKVERCHGLEYLTTYSIAQSLTQLTHIEVKDCQGLIEIVANGNQDDDAVNEIAFMRLQRLELSGLPSLQRFCSGNCLVKIPSLDTLVVTDCLVKLSISPDWVLLTDFNPERFLQNFNNLDNLVLHGDHKEIFFHEENSGEEIHAVVTLPHLTSLKLSEMNMLMHLGKENSQPIIPNLEILEVSLCGRLENLSSPAISFQNLKTLKVIGCQGLEYLITSSIAQSLMQLTRLEVKDCETLVQIVGHSSEDEAGNEIAFNRLEHLELSGLPSLQCFFSGTMLSHQFTICNEIEKSDTKENLDSAVQYFLFDKKVGLPRLETLIIHDLRKLMTIWHEQLAKEEDDTSITPSKLPEYCQNLVSVEIHSCRSLRNIFPASVAIGLQQLKKLSVKKCNRVEEIVAMEGLGMTTPEFVFPNATSVEFQKLPRLASFYPGLHTSVWPLLKSLTVTGCKNVEVLALEYSRFQANPELGLTGAPIKQPLFLLENLSLHLSRLEELHLHSMEGAMKNWWSPYPAELFSKLKSLWSESLVFQSGFLQNLPHLEGLRLYGFEKEVFVHEGISSGEIEAVGKLLPHLKRLTLYDMAELIHLGKENYQPVIPNLEFLRVALCGKLKNLTSPAVSFQNLRTLKVERCHGLEYLTTYSIAQSLTQLTHIEVKDCQGLIEIVANGNQDDDAVNEIAFMRLQRLELSGLPSLQRFCSGNCLVKIPSLDTLVVTDCLVKLSISPDWVLLTDFNPERFLQNFNNLDNLVLHGDHKEIFFHEENSGEEIHAVVTLPHLTSLKLSEMNMLMHLGKENSQPIIPNLEILEVSLCGRLENLSSPAISFQNLKTLKVIGCQGLEYLITSSIAQSLMQLTRLEVKDCERLVEIVGSSSEDEAGNEIAFNRLEHLELSGLPSLQCFFSGNMLSHQFTIFDEIEKSDTKENLDSAVQYFLFDKKVGLPRMETLIVHDLHKLMTVWHKQIAADSFCRLKKVDVQRCQSLINIFGANILGRLNALFSLKLRQCQSLRLVFENGGINAKEEDDTSMTPTKLPEYCENLVSVEIHSCESLRNIFPASVAKGLQQLRKLRVKDCDRVEEIVAMEGLGMTTPKFVFPNATSVIFQDLPRLASFYPGMHASVWPLLKVLRVKSCDNVEIFALEFSRFQAEPELGLVGTAIKQPLFLIEKGSFSNLEILHFYSEVGTMKNWWSLLPAEFFSKLKSLRSQSGVFQSGFLQNLPHLEDLRLYGSEKEVFVHEGISSAEIQAVGTLLPHLKSLRLFRMPELMHLGKENSQLVIPNLVFLRVKLCGKLKNLRSSAISFQNLKTLVVVECHELEYLITCSIAQSLMQLEHMEVKDCQGLTEIVANSNQDDDAVNEIAFMRLQRLELSGLPSLQGFCSGNCVVKIPFLDTLTVTECLNELKISPDKVLLSNSKPERLKLIEEEAKDHDKPEGSGTTRTEAT